ncbi:hypothetical protein tb265_45560 [Gemmatimonadetes bacterium T265]|nr:hypothetical protein tb265_45560 [Gemmatimonadetes bacterium T265]
MAGLEDVWRRYLALCNDRRLGELGEFVHDPLRFNGAVTSLADYAGAIASNIAAVPDFRWEVEDLVATHDTVAVRLTDTGTPRGTWLGIGPTGRSFTTQELAFYRFRGGKIAEMWFVLDDAAVRAQLAG